MDRRFFLPIGIALFGIFFVATCFSRYFKTHSWVSTFNTLTSVSSRLNQSFEQAPALFSISPTEGEIQGGTFITLVGLGFEKGAQVFIGLNECGSVDVLSATHITCITPRQSEGGMVDIEVRLPGGLLTARLKKAFAYLAPLEISPKEKKITLHNSIQFTAQGGVPPYTYNLVGGSDGDIGETGTYRPFENPGIAEVAVRDARGKTDTAQIEIFPILKLKGKEPLQAVFQGQLQLQTEGGVPPLKYRFNGIPFGLVDENSGMYFSPAEAGQTVVVISDANENKISVRIQVNSLLKLSPIQGQILAGSGLQFSASGGLAPYRFSVAGNSGARVDSTTGWVSVSAATTPGSLEVMVEDAAGQKKTVSVKVLASGKLAQKDLKSKTPETIFNEQISSSTVSQEGNVQNPVSGAGEESSMAAALRDRSVASLSESSVAFEEPLLVSTLQTIDLSTLQKKISNPDSGSLPSVSEPASDSSPIFPQRPGTPFQPTLPAPPNASPEYAQIHLIQPLKNGQFLLVWSAQRRMGLAKYERNGRLDTSGKFGAHGEGWVELPKEFYREQGIYGLSLEKTGKFDVLSSPLLANDSMPARVVRLTSVGISDGSLGDFEKTGVPLETNGEAELLSAVASQKLEAQEKWILGGQVLQTNGKSSLVVRRLLWNGRRDESFGMEGRFTEAVGSDNVVVQSIMTQSDGGILVSGKEGDRRFLLRILSDGKSLDHRFGIVRSN